MGSTHLAQAPEGINKCGIVYVAPMGTLSFDAREQPGSYDIRLHDTDGGGTEIASVTFTVN